MGSAMPRSLSVIATRRTAYTLLELILVIVLLAAVAGVVYPRLANSAEDRALRASAQQMRSLLELVRAQAQWDGLRYRIRMAKAEELDQTGDDRQPIVEREKDPLNAPNEWTPVLADWAQRQVYREDVWCIQVRLGRPTVDTLMNPDVKLDDELLSLGHDFDPDYPPVIFEPDGSAPWATFVVTQVDRDMKPEELGDEEERIEVIMEGSTGMVWLQRGLYEQELELFSQNGWPVVQRRDFLDPKALTEDDVLELMEESTAPDMNAEAMGLDSGRG